MGSNQGDYLLVRLSDYSLGLVHYTGISELLKLEDSQKTEDWGIFSSMFVFMIFFSVFIFCITKNNTKAAGIRAKQAESKNKFGFSS